MVLGVLHGLGSNKTHVGGFVGALLFDSVIGDTIAAVLLLAWIADVGGCCGWLTSLSQARRGQASLPLWKRDAASSDLATLERTFEGTATISFSVPASTVNIQSFKGGDEEVIRVILVDVVDCKVVED